MFGIPFNKFLASRRGNSRGLVQEIFGISFGDWDIVKGFFGVSFENCWRLVSPLQILGLTLTIHNGKAR